MIYFFGDLHGDFRQFADEINSLKNATMVIQVGDFGFFPNFSGTKMATYQPDGKHYFDYEPRVPPLRNNVPVYFCDGNHEDHWSLRKHLGDGKTAEVMPGIHYVRRGEILELEGYNILFIGGANSIDKELRTVGVDWFPEEDISFKEFNHALGNIQYSKKKVDIVVSHAPPNSVNDKFSSKTGDALDELISQFPEPPPLWFFGHIHEHMEIKKNGTRFISLDMIGFPGDRCAVGHSV